MIASLAAATALAALGLDDPVFLIGADELADDVARLERHALVDSARPLEARSKHERLVGLAQLISEANGLAGEAHIKEKISEMIIHATVVRACYEAGPTGYELARLLRLPPRHRLPPENCLNAICAAVASKASGAVVCRMPAFIEG